MKKIICLIVLIYAYQKSTAQDKSDSTTVSLDILRAPSSPAANLLGISNSQIEKPTDPTAFATTINQATGNFSTLPTSYAIDLAPAWIWWGRNITHNKFMSDERKYTIPQSLVFSFGTKSTDSLGNTSTQNPYTTKFSSGIKFSIFRGNVDSDVEKKLSKLRSLRKLILRKRDSLVFSSLENSKEAKSLKKSFDSLARLRVSKTTDSLIAMVQSQRVKLEAKIQKQVDSTYTFLKNKLEQTKVIAEQIKFKRYGGKLDFATGLVWDFPKQNTEQGKLTKAAAWITGGWDTKSGFSALFIFRYQYNPDQIFADEKKVIHTANNTAIDGGGRIVYTDTASPFSISSEAIYRSVNNSLVKPSWRITLNAEYDIGKNKKLTFIFGRDFDGTVTKDGNLITALNLLLGFGSKKNMM